MGKSFLVTVKNEAGMEITRQYTLAQCMHPDVYPKFVEAIRGKQSPVPKSKDQLVITCKNYGTGLSLLLHKGTYSSLKFTGPVGKGLGLRTDGTYVAFVGGTGILPFLDLIALIHSGSPFLSATFKLVIYASFHTRAEALGLELLEIPHTQLQVHLRIKSETSGRQERWDADFVQKQMAAWASATKIFVCGPPSMTELFDRTVGSSPKIEIL